MSEQSDHPLARARKKDGISQVQLGEMVGVDGMTVSRWENGVSVPRKRFWTKLEQFAGRPIAEILTACHKSEGA